MKYGLAWIDPVTNEFDRWSVTGFSDSDADRVEMQKCIAQHNARQSPENPEYQLLIILPIGDDGEPIIND